MKYSSEIDDPIKKAANNTSADNIGSILNKNKQDPNDSVSRY
jgi:hypothetical protein